MGQFDSGLGRVFGRQHFGNSIAQVRLQNQRLSLESKDTP
jgi:hypothetical protein